jgi:hypothetical protein
MDDYRPTPKVNGWMGAYIPPVVGCGGMSCTLPFAPQMWEAVEIFRKLLLSVLGVFFSNKEDPFSVATALFISCVFLLLHAIYLPYKDGSCNRLQFVNLAVLCIVYYVGLLLKTQTMPGNENLGGFMVFLLVIVFLLALYQLCKEVETVRSWAKTTRSSRQVQQQHVSQIDASLREVIIEEKDLQMGKILGQGAEGVVRQAKYSGTDVAVKVQDCTADNMDYPLADQIKEAQGEAQKLMRLRHPHVVLFYGLGIRYGSVVVQIMTVLELCKTAVQDWILDKANTISMRERVECCQQVAQGMAFLHSKGVMHR